ncbi:hypothetical protein Nmel_004773 [Mimus melanotis]
MELPLEYQHWSKQIYHSRLKRVSSCSGSSSKEEDETTDALNRQRKGNIARKAIRECSPIAKGTRSKKETKEEPVLQAPLCKQSATRGQYITVENYCGKIKKKNPDKVAKLVERAINTQNTLTDLNSYVRHIT